MNPEFLNWLEQQQYTYYIDYMGNRKGWCIRNTKNEHYLAYSVWLWKEIIQRSNNICIHNS